MQLHVLETFATVGATKITKKPRAEVVASLTSLKGNINGYIKVCAYTEGRKYQETIKKKYVSSPTVTTESVFRTASLDTH